MMSLTFGLFTQVSGSGPLGPLVYICVDVISDLVVLKGMFTIMCTEICS